jgi:hypothetical protein
VRARAGAPWPLPGRRACIRTVPRAAPCCCILSCLLWATAPPAPFWLVAMGLPVCVFVSRLMQAIACVGPSPALRVVLVQVTQEEMQQIERLEQLVGPMGLDRQAGTPVCWHMLTSVRARALASVSVSASSVGNAGPVGASHMSKR